MFRLFRYISFVFMLLLAVPLAAQERPAWLNAWEIPKAPFTCEENLIHLERLAFLMYEEIERRGKLIVISRLGDGETSRQLNRRRLHNVREKQKERGVPPEVIIIAEGERVRGYGRVEFYLGGKMVGGLLIKRNEDICVECCGLDERYYPDIEILARQRRKRR